MKVFLKIWILAVLIQEVIPSTLVRLPRHAEKNLSLVHTEYEAKYEQKGKHGNESFSSVSGKQEIVHDNCAENWNSFAEKCASLIKDLVASLANAVSSKPGDATNLQLHIKNTFKHFDNTHNCTCLNHTEKTLADLNLSPLFKNITINTVGPGTKTDDENGSGAKRKKCGEKGQPCDGDNASDTTADKNIMPGSFDLNGVGGDKNGFDLKQSKENGQPPNELCDGQDDISQAGKVAEEQKPQNRALVDTEDLDMNPENAEGSSDQSTNNSRRQIKYPQNLMKPQKISKNSGDSDFNPFASDLKQSSLNPKRPEDDHNPFFVTPRPKPQSAKSFESSADVLNPPSLSGLPLESDFPKSPEYEPSHVLLSQENSSPSTDVPSHSSSVKSNAMPSPASYLLTSPNNGNSIPNNNYLGPAPQTMTESHSSFINEEDPKEDILPSNDSRSYQKPLSSPLNPMTNTNNQSPAIISEEPFTKDYNSEPAVLVPAKTVNNKPYAQSSVVLPEKPITDSQTLNPVVTSVKPFESERKLVPSVMQPEKPVSDSKSSDQPIATLPESPPLMDTSDSELALPLKPVDSEPNTSSPVNLPEQLVTASHLLEPGFISEEKVESGPDAILSPITKSSQRPTVVPETEDIASDLSEIVPNNYKSSINPPVTIPTVPVESEQLVSFPGEFNLPKTIKSESSGLIPENSAGNNYNSEPLLLTQNKKPIEEPLKEWLIFTTPKTYDSDETSAHKNEKSGFSMNVPEEYPEAFKGLPSPIPAINYNKNFPQSSGSESNVVTLNPSPIYKPLDASSSSNLSPGSVIPDQNSPVLSPEDILPMAANEQPFIKEPDANKSPIYKPSSTDSSLNSLADIVAPSKNPEILSPKDILPVPANEQPLFEEQTTTEYARTTRDGLDDTTSMIKPISAIPEVANQQSRISTSTEKQLPDKPNQLNAPDSQISSHLMPEVLESALPQKPFSGAQYPDTEIVNTPTVKLQYPQQSIQEQMFTTPLPFYPVKTVTVIPSIGQQLNPQPAVITENPEVHEPQGKDFTSTETSTISNIPGASLTKDQQKQPSTEVVGGTPLNEKQVNTPKVVPEIAATTPVIIYPVKPLPIPSQPSEQSYLESSHPVLVSSSDGNQKPEVQTVLFTTPVPVYPVKPIQALPVTTEQQNGNAGSPLQPAATTTSYLTPDSLSEQEHPVIHAPVRGSDSVQYPQVVVKPDEIPTQLTPSNFDDHLQSTTNLDSVPAGNSKTIPVISSGPQLVTVVPSTLLKPPQSDVLIQNTEVHPHQEEEQHSVLIQPTTFQTTSEDPTPSRVNVPGLLTHTTSVPQDSDETMPVEPLTSPKTTSIYENDEDDDEDCCSCESCTEEEITNPKQYKETACKNLEEARKELKAIFDKIKKKLKCDRKAPQTITSS